MGCTSCLNRLAGWDEYIGAVRGACRSLHSPRARTAGEYQ